MEWKLKMMLSMAFLVIIFADIFGYGNAKSKRYLFVKSLNLLFYEHNRYADKSKKDKTTKT
jgi:hypothetical protein